MKETASKCILQTALNNVTAHALVVATAMAHAMETAMGLVVEITAVALMTLATVMGLAVEITAMEKATVADNIDFFTLTM